MKHIQFSWSKTNIRVIVQNSCRLFCKHKATDFLAYARNIRPGPTHLETPTVRLKKDVRIFKHSFDYYPPLTEHYVRGPCAKLAAEPFTNDEDHFSLTQP